MSREHLGGIPRRRMDPRDQDRGHLARPRRPPRQPHPRGRPCQPGGGGDSGQPGDLAQVAREAKEKFDMKTSEAREFMIKNVTAIVVGLFNVHNSLIAANDPADEEAAKMLREFRECRLPARRN